MISTFLICVTMIVCTILICVTAIKVAYTCVGVQISSNATGLMSKVWNLLMGIKASQEKKE